MNKRIFFILLLLLLVGGMVSVTTYRSEKQAQREETVEQTQEQAVLNCTVRIDGQSITLHDGYAEASMPASSSTVITRYFGNEVSGDVNKDGISDTAFLLTQDLSGSGTFYYVAVALGGEVGCVGTNAIGLGDRIAPQSTTVQDGTIVVNFSERKPGEPMTAAPSVGVSRYFLVEGQTLREVDQPL